jgi:hypothetical protein
MLVLYFSALSSNLCDFIMDEMVKDQVFLSSWGLQLLISMVVLIRQ